MATLAPRLTTPTAALGGEAVKMWLLRGHAPLDERLLSVVVAKTTILIAQGLFLLFGTVLAWLVVPPDSALLGGMLWLLLLEVLVVGVFVVAQTKGMLGRGQRFLQQIRRRSSGESSKRRICSPNSSGSSDCT